MNYAITGAAGNISRPLVKKLLKAGHSVTIIGRDRNHLEELVQVGAQPAIGTIENVEFLKFAFARADAVYTMYPPNFATLDIKKFIEQVAKNYSEAIQTNGIKYVVNLTAMGTHLAEGAGPISGLNRAEKLLNALPNVNIKHLRPGYFYTGFFRDVEMIKQIGIIGSNFSMENLPLADVSDIANAAAEELMNLNFNGITDRYIVSDERSTDEIAAVLGDAIGKPELKWVRFNNDQVLQGMIQSGVPKELANDYVEMLAAINNEDLWKEYWKNRPMTFTGTSLEEFGKLFANVYRGNG